MSSEIKREIDDLEHRLEVLREGEEREKSDSYEEQSEELSAGTGNPYLIPGSIILAGIVIAIAIVSVRGGFAPSKQLIEDVNAPDGAVAAITPGPAEMKPVSSDDHIRGSESAAIKIVEFSDTECPFCQRFHGTMKRIMDDYGSTGQVAWVYRHFPLDNLHPKARVEAEATECAAELGGGDVFWEYLDTIFKITPSNNGLDLGELPNIAEDVGLNRADFVECLNSRRHAERINEDIVDATNSGAGGTPYSVLVTANGERLALPGAQTYEQMVQVIDVALAF